MIKKNGFSFPLHPYQILSWVIFAFHCVFPGTVILPLLPLGDGIVFAIFFYSSQAGVLILGYALTKSNPTIRLSKDPLYLETAENINFYCTICTSYVTKSAKHCGSCDRCVDRFDHHCKWLNNCIGGSNYKPFISLLLFLYTNGIILLSFELKLLSPLPNKLSLSILLILDCSLNILISFLLTYLLGIHIMLKFKGMTTYEYIKSIRKQKEKKINPTENKETDEKKNLNSADDVKKSIIKPGYQSNIENAPSCSLPKLAEDFAYLTLQHPLDTETDRVSTNIH